MSDRSEKSSPTWLTHLGDIRWVRGHISTFCIGAVLLVCINLLLGNNEMWSLTAVGIWIMLLIVHIVVVLIARLSLQLAADDDEEVVLLLPVKDAVVVEPSTTTPPTWNADSPQVPETEAQEPVTTDTVSWTVATDMAQAKRVPKEDKPE